jgi:curved DNA-binding protein CbpA
MQSDDYYSTLGVLPDADDVVIKAAYRALAQRYHPDKWPDDADEANRRMAALNKAYEVLGNKQSRADYDKSRENTGRAEFGSKESEGQDEAFSSALNEIEERWAIAVEIFPDLIEYRGKLAKISTALAFEFVAGLLESKDFKNRAEWSSNLENLFLIRHFGTNKIIINYALSLILTGNKAAARKLNQIVDVLGAGVDADLIINRVEQLPELIEYRRKKEAELRADPNKLSARECYAQNLFEKVREGICDCLFLKNGQAAVYFHDRKVLRIYKSIDDLRADISQGWRDKSWIDEFHAWRGI